MVLGWGSCRDKTQTLVMQHSAELQGQDTNTGHAALCGAAGTRHKHWSCSTLRSCRDKTQTLVMQHSAELQGQDTNTGHAALCGAAGTRHNTGHAALCGAAGTRHKHWSCSTLRSCRDKTQTLVMQHSAELQGQDTNTGHAALCGAAGTRHKHWSCSTLRSCRDKTQTLVMQHSATGNSYRALARDVTTVRLSIIFRLFLKMCGTVGSTVILEN